MNVQKLVHSGHIRRPSALLVYQTSEISWSISPSLSALTWNQMTSGSRMSNPWGSWLRRSVWTHRLLGRELLDGVLTAAVALEIQRARRRRPGRPPCTSRRCGRSNRCRARCTPDRARRLSARGRAGGSMGGQTARRERVPSRLVSAATANYNARAWCLSSNFGGTKACRSRSGGGCMCCGSDMPPVII